MNRSSEHEACKDKEVQGMLLRYVKFLEIDLDDLSNEDAILMGRVRGHLSMCKECEEQLGDVVHYGIRSGELRPVPVPNFHPPIAEPSEPFLVTEPQTGDVGANDLPELVLAEVANLLLSARIPDDHTGTRARVAVSISPYPAAEEFRQVQVVCRAASEVKVDWERVAIWMTAERSGNNWFEILDSSGKSRPMRVHFSDVASVRFRDPGMFGVDLLREVGAQLVSLGQFEGKALFGPAPPKLRKASTDGRLTAHTEIEADHTLRVIVETQHVSLRGGNVAFEVRSQLSGKVLYYDEFQLRFGNGTRGECPIRDELLAIKEPVELFLYPVRKRRNI